MKIVNVVGARPNLMKIAPLMDAYRGREEIEPLLVHTGQHYDANVSDLFFRQLGIPEPEINLEVGSASHAVQTVEMGTNRIVGQDPERIVTTHREVMERGAGGGRVPPLWDGRAADRIVEVLIEAL